MTRKAWTYANSSDIKLTLKQYVIHGQWKSQNIES